MYGQYSCSWSHPTFGVDLKKVMILYNEVIKVFMVIICFDWDLSCLRVPGPLDKTGGRRCYLLSNKEGTFFGLTNRVQHA
jgi:hypothetical protein